jgi:glycerol kinase
MKKYILSIDQGTTGTTALLIDTTSFELVAKYNEEFPQIFPKPGYVEHNLNDIWATVKNCTNAVIKSVGATGQDIECIGITNQRETTCAFNQKGEPICNAIVWQDRRTADYCSQRKTEYVEKYQRLTGLPLDPYFSGTKIVWMLNNSPAVQEAKERNDLKFGTIDTYLLYKMTNGGCYRTEPSNASRTLLMDLNSTQWSEELLHFFNIDPSHLPEIQDSFSEFGQTKGLDFLPDGIPISCILGDQQAALFGQAGHSKGSLKCTYGTGAFILLNTGEEKIYSSSGLLTTLAYRHNGKSIYALEGSSFIAGAAVQWLRDNLGIIESSPEVEKLARDIGSIDEMEHLIFYPFFSGIGSPYWEPSAKGAILGLTRGTRNQHITRACLDGIALAINDSIQSLINDFPKGVESIKVDGGACANNLLMELQAGFSQRQIVRPKIIETTAYGVALGAMIGIEKLTFSGIEKLWKQDEIFIPTDDPYFKYKQQQWTDGIKRIFLT